MVGLQQFCVMRLSECFIRILSTHSDSLRKEDCSRCVPCCLGDREMGKGTGWTSTHPLIQYVSKIMLQEWKWGNGSRTSIENWLWEGGFCPLQEPCPERNFQQKDARSELKWYIKSSPNIFSNNQIIATLAPAEGLKGIEKYSFMKDCFAMA